MFLVDKYAPKKIQDSLFHKPELQILEKMAHDDQIPHTLFYGPDGVGKKTLIKLFLEMIYDEQVNKLNDSIYEVSGSGNKKTQVAIKQSNYHIIIEPNNNNFDRYLIQDVVKEYAKKVPLNVFTSHRTFKMVLINNVDNLSYYAQTSLRRTMEKYSGTCRFIMWSRSLSRVIDPIRSRCYCFRINTPNNSQLFDMIADISFKESIKLSLTDYNEILDSSKGNIKKVLWMLQFKKIHQDYINDLLLKNEKGVPVENVMDVKKIYNTSFDDAINEIVELILQKNIGLISKIRDSSYDIMITNIPGTKIIRSIIEKLLQSDLTEKCKSAIPEVVARFEHHLIRGRREIIHLEALFQSIIYIIHSNS